MLGGAELLVRGAAQLARTFGVSSLVVGSRALTIGGEEPDVKSLVATILEMEDLKMDLCAHILKEGAVTQDEGKD